jgi:uncharacterized membrane protein YhaH (DUF805 family)
MVSCPACGGQVHETAPYCPQCGARQPARGGDGIPRTFGNSVAICFRKFAEFRGRAPRAEFWYFVLFYLIVHLAAILVGVGLGGRNGGELLEVLAWLVLVAPSISVQVRRLHDIDRSGWWYWIGLLPLVGWIVLLVWNCTAGTPAANRFGPPNGTFA